LVILTALPVTSGGVLCVVLSRSSAQDSGWPGLIVSPGDGKVKEAEWIETTAGNRLRITIFLSVFDVHVNRVPIGGTVTLVDTREGQFLNAMKPESAVLNEQTMITIDGGDYSVSFKQIAGLLARRIVCNLSSRATAWSAGSGWG
jgi:phosphatidylserine decarboxylase